MLVTTPWQYSNPDAIAPKTQKKVQSKGVSYEHYAGRPIDFAYEVLGVKYLTSDVKKILQSVCDNRVTNVQASHAVGKSFCAGFILVLYWVFAVRGLCITTAPTERQVKEILWSETRRSHALNKAKLGGKAGELFLKLDEDARAFGFTARSTDSNGFQGVHAENLLLIEDEACGISPAIDEGAESCLTGSGNRLLRIGNPLADQTPFAKACRRSHISIPAFGHSNVQWAYRQDSDGFHRVKEELRPYLFGENGKVLDREHWGKPAIAAMQEHLESIGAVEIKGAISVEWIEDKRDKYHEGSAFWEARIEARFPLDAGASVIPRRYFLMARIKFDQEVERLAKTPIKTIQESLRHIPPRYGVDVGDGGDPHAIARWQGNCLWFVKPYPTLGDELDTARAVTYLKKEIAQHGDGFVGVDNIGVGAGTLAIAKTDGIVASGIGWGEKAKESDRFANLKAEQYWTLREQAEAGELMIAPLGEWEEELQEDWASTYYEETVKGQIRIEDKRKARERLGRSTNCGDSAIYAYHAQSAINPLLM